MRSDPLGHPQPLSRRLLPFLLVLTLGTGAILAWKVYGRGGPLHDPSARPRTVTPRGELGADESSTIQVFQTSAPAVVHISNLRLSGQVSLEGASVRQGTGSGFVWDSRGYIVTNYHVVEGGDAWKIHLRDGSSHDGRYVGGDPEGDVAVLKIDPPSKGLSALLIGTSHDLQVGQKVFAIGNPFGLDQTLTTGVISGLNREISTGEGQRIRGVIQTDAAINPGNSGGPLLDSAGRLIGMNTAIYSTSGAYAGIGFAVPVNTINRIVPRIMQSGSYERPGLGIILFDAGNISLEGALVGNVVEGSAAERAGILPTRYDRFGNLIAGDLITKVDSEPVNNSDDLLDILSRRAIGDTVQVEIVRKRRKLKVPVVLQALSREHPGVRRR